MNYFLAKKIDKIFRIPPIVYIFLALKLFSDKFFGGRENKDFKKLYVVKLLGGGSLCILTPYLAELKKDNNIQIILISSSFCSGFVKNLGVFDDIVEIDRISGLFQFIKISLGNLINKKNEKNCSVAINFEFHSAIAAYVASMLFSGKNCGVMNNLSAPFAKIYDRKVFYNGHANIGEAYICLIEKSLNLELLLPIEKSSSEISRYIQDLENSIQISNFDVTKDYIAISPFSSGLSPERELTSNQIVAALNAQDASRAKVTVAILGAKADAYEAEKLAKFIESMNDRYDVKNLCGVLSVYQSAVVARNSSVYLTIDSGLNHYVRMTSARMIKSFWGPTNPKIMLNNHFYHGREQVFYKKIFCSPCVHIVDRAPCGGNNVCMKELVIEKS